jgi:hypothetical protein
VEGRSKEEVRSFLTRKFNEDLPAREIEGMERSYKRLGLIPDSLGLRSFMLELLTEQVVGYYDPSTKVLYVVEGSPDDLVGVTVTHEMVHALQDQYLNLDSIQKIAGDNDRQTAAQSVIEGQATYEQLQTMLGGANFATIIPGGWDKVRDVIRESQSGMPVFSTAPMVIQETLLFPYINGAEFVLRFKERQPGKPPFSDMPASTEQVLHADAYFTARDAPTRITLPALAVGKNVYENNLGEFETRLFLYQHLQDQNAAFRGAAGWDGDRYVLFDTSAGEGIAWLTVWDSAVDAGEFYDLVSTAIGKRFAGANARQAGGARQVYDAGTRTLAVTTADLGGRASVLYVDVPKGTRTDVIDPGRVKLSQP